MEKRLYVDVHVIQTVPPSCVNRDDSGSPKTAVYGGARRARVSSQSWKRAMRVYFRERFDESQLGVRTMKIVEMVADEIVKMEPSTAKADAVKKAQDILTVAGVKTKVKPKKEGDIPESEALFFLSAKQAENMAMLALKGCDNKKEVQTALNMGSGVDIALFGRMVADDPSLNTDASAQVAHSISTHRVENEYDYFTAVDEKSPENNAGAGMIGTVEFNSSTMYRYATLAVHDLFKQLSEDSEVASKTVVEFVRAFVKSMPTGKQNTFANRTLPDAVLITVRNDQPINLVGAFESPVRANKDTGGYVAGSVKALADYEAAVCSTFASKPVKTWQIGNGLEALGPSTGLDAALDDLTRYIREQ